MIYTASFKRAHLSHRAVIKGDTANELINGLEALAAEIDSDKVVRGVKPFQGRSQTSLCIYWNGGRSGGAWAKNCIARKQFTATQSTKLTRYFKRLLVSRRWRKCCSQSPASRISSTQIAQPANLLIQIGILAILRAAGVDAGAVVGHSVGELASAYAAEALSLRDVMTVCFHRSRLQACCAGMGGMMAVGLSKSEALNRIADCTDRVSIAAVNGPTNVTLAGNSNDLARLAAALEAEQTFHRMLDVEVAYHSPIMEQVMGELAESIKHIRPTAPAFPIYSTVTGGRISGVAFGANYWPLNIRKSVEFAHSIQAILNDGFNTFIEIGPHPVLATSLKDCIKAAGKECRTLYTLRRNTSERASIHRAIMGIFAEGCTIDWSKHRHDGKFTSLPNYAWQRQKFWLENERGIQDRIAPIEHPVLGIQEAPGTTVWRNDFDHEPVAYLRDHVVTGMPVLPAAAYVEALLELAGIQFPNAQCLLIRDLAIQAPMLIGAERSLDCVTTYESLSQAATIRSLENGRLGFGQVHITAKIAGVERCESQSIDLSKLLTSFTTSENVASFYRGLAQMGLSYGPAFQTVRQLKLNEFRDQVLARIEMQPEQAKNCMQYYLHPTVLDACLPNSHRHAWQYLQYISTNRHCRTGHVR